MNNKFLTFLILFIFSMGFSQEITIPFRDGKLWGLCDENGKMTLEPKFESLEFLNDYDSTQDVLIPKIGSKEGLIINGKVVFEPIYEHIYQNNNLYFTTKIQNNIKISDVIDLDGKSILNKPVIEIISNKKINNDIYIFHLLNDDYTETFFLYDIGQKKIIQTLYENYYSINFIKKQSDYFSVSFLVKKTEKDPLIAEAWDITKLPNEITKTKLLYRTENEYLEKFLKKSYQEKSNDYEESSRGYGSGNGDIKGDYDSGIVVESPRDETNSNNKINKTFYINYNFTKKENQLVLTKKTENQNKSISEVLVNLKIPLKEIAIKNYNYNSKKNDTISYFSNFIQYKKNGKSGLLFGSDLKKTVEFDSIGKNINSFSDSNSYNREVVFLVANKDKKTNQFKYSLYSNSKGLLFPMQFDDLIYTSKLYSYNGISSFISRIGTKYGIVQIDGTTFLKTEYDEIKENQKYESSRSFKKIFELRKENKFGLIFQDIITYKPQLIDAIFDYEIKELFFNYPKLQYKKTTASNSEIPKKITLISLKDKRGNLVGYANSNGMLYFKN